MKWRHQAPVGPFYADILCFAEKLILEIVGDTHASTSDYDHRRTRFLQGEGYTVTRFVNTDVMQNLDGVLTSIALSLREREGAAQPRKGEDGCIQKKCSAA